MNESETNKTATIDDVLEAVHKFANKTEEQFDKIDERFDKIDERFEKIDERFEKIDQRFEKIDQRFDSLEKNLRLEIGKARDEAFVYADKKSFAVIAKLDEIIDKHEEHENKFKQELVSAMKRNSLLGAKDIKQLEGAI